MYIHLDFLYFRNLIMQAVASNLHGIEVEVDIIKRKGEPVDEEDKETEGDQEENNNTNTTSSSNSANNDRTQNNSFRRRKTSTTSSTSEESNETCKQSGELLLFLYYFLIIVIYSYSWKLSLEYMMFNLGGYKRVRRTFECELR